MGFIYFDWLGVFWTINDFLENVSINNADQDSKLIICMIAFRSKTNIFVNRKPKFFFENRIPESWIEIF